MDSAGAAAEIRGDAHRLAGDITQLHFERRPELATRYGRIGKRRCEEDVAFHLSFLAVAVEADDPAIFVDYIAWSKIVLVTRGVPAEDLREVLGIMREVLGDPVAAKPVGAAIDALDGMPVELPTFIRDETAASYLQSLLHLDERGATRIVADALGRRVPPRDLADIFASVQHEVGRLWQMNRITVAVEHFCSSVTQKLMSQIAVERRAARQERRKLIVAMCAPGEQHELGLRATSELLSLDGWRVLYLGANVPVRAAVQLCASREADALLVAASLASHAARVAEVVNAVRAEPALTNMRTIVGGRAFANHTQLWRLTGAHAFASNAAEVTALLDAI